MTTPSERRYSGISLSSNIGGIEFGIDSAGVMIPDPDDPNRIIVVPLTAVRLIFCPALRGAKAVVPQDW